MTAGYKNIKTDKKKPKRNLNFEIDYIRIKPKTFGQNIF